MSYDWAQEDKTFLNKFFDGRNDLKGEDIKNNWHLLLTIINR